MIEERAYGICQEMRYGGPAAGVIRIREIGNLPPSPVYKGCTIEACRASKQQKTRSLSGVDMMTISCCICFIDEIGRLIAVLRGVGGR